MPGWVAGSNSHVSSERQARSQEGSLRGICWRGQLSIWQPAKKHALDLLADDGITQERPKEAGYNVAEFNVDARIGDGVGGVPLYQAEPGDLKRAHARRYRTEQTSRMKCPPAQR